MAYSRADGDLHCMGDSINEGIKEIMNALSLTLSTCTCQYSSWIVLAGLVVILEKNVGCVR